MGKTRVEDYSTINLTDMLLTYGPPIIALLCIALIYYIYRLLQTYIDSQSTINTENAKMIQTLMTYVKNQKNVCYPDVSPKTPQTPQTPQTPKPQQTPQTPQTPKPQQTPQTPQTQQTPQTPQTQQTQQRPKDLPKKIVETVEEEDDEVEEDENVEYISTDVSQIKGEVPIELMQ
jgi:outer membrane biosynthesis protein TonB